MTEATSRPWFCFANEVCVGGPFPEDPGTAGIALCAMARRNRDENVANAAFIIRAVNAFDDLVAVVEETRSYLLANGLHRGEFGSGLYKKAEAALEKARLS